MELLVTGDITTRSPQKPTSATLLDWRHYTFPLLAAAMLSNALAGCDSKRPCGCEGASAGVYSGSQSSYLLRAQGAISSLCRRGAYISFSSFYSILISAGRFQPETIQFRWAWPRWRGLGPTWPLLGGGGKCLCCGRWVGAVQGWDEDDTVLACEVTHILL